MPVDAGTLLLRYRAERIVVATGTVEQPLVFPGNDLVGVLLPGAVRRLVGDWSVKPGERAVVIGGEGAVESLVLAGVEIAELADPASVRSISARGSKGRLREVELDGKTVECDLAVVSGGRQPAYSLLAQAGARVEYDAVRRVFVPRDLPAGIDAVGSITGGGSTAAPSYRGKDAKGRCFVCVCEDVTEKDVERAIREGFDSIELSKRYTTVTMGPCQGKYCQLPSIRLHAAKTGVDEAAIGTTTARPPWAPVELGLLAGRHHDPVRRSSLHERHEQAGARLRLGRSVAAAPLLRRPRGGGRRSARRPGRDRRLHARQAARRGPRRGALPGAALPEPLRRPRRGPRPLHGARHRRRPDHGRRHRRPARR